MSGAYSTAIDAHTHLDFPAFEADRAAVCARARAKGVGGWVIAGADPTHWGRVERVAAQTGGVAVLGIHPWWSTARADLDELARRATHGIGEIGLDRARGSLAEQEALFRDQLAIARHRDLPVVLHCVRAYPELLRLLRDDGVPSVGGMVHGWNGPAELAAEFVDLGLSLSFGTRLCGNPGRRVRTSVVTVPGDRLLLETDCPDQALAGRARGEPVDLLEVARAAAAHRGGDVDALLHTTAVNARRLFPALDA